ncbi:MULTISPECIES: carboxymuconolactone decarboxylase family protein [unclassified Arthrobacter]|uniref:carboxymuconolactone decarboxylase family protein n=1 Tax=unclassified Arthrobacter TaxID=235627 RepID=UPI001C8568EE|nr:carboxymuconolactone decarboxylase family protein [Arthrobacter sp. MAHUQ-56]MBX7444617.1 carboxymuconolactone decarboxylase family protein [Arthrobacter sp. MAHUQ-56]
MGPLQDTGAYLRYGSELPRRYFEYVVLLVAAHWDQPFEWAHHEPLARAAGVTDEDVRSARAGTQPASDDLVPLHDMVTELLRTGRVSSHRFAPVESLLSSSKLIDLLGTVGYYTSLALIMNVADAPVTAGPSGSTP